MQIVESNMFGVRVACYRLRRPSSQLEFVLLPMIHIGSTAYYAKVQAILEGCDEVIFEGLGSSRTTLLTSSYRWPTYRRRLQLVTQKQAICMGKLKARLVHADVSGSEFQHSWQRINWRHRIAMQILAPLYGIWLFLTASRESIGKRLGRDDLRTRNDILRDETVPGFDAAFSDERDQRLIGAIESAQARDAPGSKVAIVYGAAHMHAVLNHLMAKHGYIVVGSDWLTVMDYDT